MKGKRGCFALVHTCTHVLYCTVFTEVDTAAFAPIRYNAIKYYNPTTNTRFAEIVACVRACDKSDTKVALVQTLTCHITYFFSLFRKQKVQKKERERE